MIKTLAQPQPTDKEQEKRNSSPLGHIFRFIGWWFGFAGLYAAFTVCPFCGQQGCPVGIGTAGTLGAFLSLCVQDWKRFIIFIRQKKSQLQKYQKSSLSRKWKSRIY